MNKFNVLLDLDETLISAKTETELENCNLDLSNFKVITMDHYFIYERPFLQDFLDWLFDNFNVSVWSAGSKDYVFYIVEHIIYKNKKRKLDFILYADHCDLVPPKTKPKNLDYMFFGNKHTPHIKRDNTVIVDDLNKVYNNQPDNCIPIYPFDVCKKGSEIDDELLKIADDIKEYFENKINTQNKNE
jgi:TFIIF-interacting CTD phosphatase-like protein